MKKDAASMDAEIPKAGFFLIEVSPAEANRRYEAQARSLCGTFSEATGATHPAVVARFLARFETANLFALEVIDQFRDCFADLEMLAARVRRRRDVCAA